MKADMKLFVDSSLVRGLMEQDHGGIENFVESWRERDAQLGRIRGLARDEKTIYGWLQKGLPARRETIFDFFAMLGCDPISLIDITRSDFPKNFSRIRLAFLLGGNSAGAFRYLFELYRPGCGWPNEELSQTLLGKHWEVRDHLHSAGGVVSKYAMFCCKLPKFEIARPLAFHIAYRRVLNADDLWRPYGTVIVRTDECHLIHENGFMQRKVRTSTNSPVQFQTFFGPSTLEFRVASLTPFSLSVDFPSCDQGALRFIA